MAGRRLLDVARLLAAGTSIGKQHLAQRSNQLKLFTQTSSLAKAVKSQTDRVTVTLRAAAELGKRLNETDRAVERDDRGAGRYDAYPEEGPTSSEPQLNAYGEVRVNSTRPQEHAPGQDTYNERPVPSSGISDSQPDSQLPKEVQFDLNHSQGTHSQELNQDVFPAPPSETTPVAAGDPAQEINTDVFISPRVAHSLKGDDGAFVNPYAALKRRPAQPLPEMIAAGQKWQEERSKAASQTDATAVASQTAGAEIGPESDSGDSIESLAKDLQSDAAQSSGAAVEEPTANTTAPEAPYRLKESKVPSTRFGRIWEYSGLATGMAFGAVGESFRRLTGSGSTGSFMLSESNMNRLVSKLSRMRGAALKLGQMISFQDSKALPPAINTVLQRVQDSADYMPAWQRDRVLIRNLGENWRDLFETFEERPFAAASIGQVHKARLAKDGTHVAVKIQYPGVRDSIDSDLSNLSLLLNASQLLPRGLFLDKTIANARTELGWECDYRREAQACHTFRDDLLVDESDIFAVPKIFDEACGPDVLTAEFMHGTAVTKIPDLTQAERDHIGSNILRLCLRELMEWQFMQTDPNWTNFLYDRGSRRIQLLDFGASRQFPDSFVEPYVALLKSASTGDRNGCRDHSLTLGYLTGNESPAMLAAHVDSILTLAEPFVASAPEIYDFKDQTITDRVRANIGLMLRERQAPPPEETYSLHRKLSGAFLLCARLESRVPARDMFQKAIKVWDHRPNHASKVPEAS